MRSHELVLHSKATNAAMDFLSKLQWGHAHAWHHDMLSTKLFKSEQRVRNLS